jgi:DNA polymerase III delta prime subunit
MQNSSPCLPGLYPREGIRYKAPPTERRVFDAIRISLPPGWYAWHSMKLCAEGQDFAEADFLIVSPAHGAMILEVKGGAIRKEGGTWFQNDRPMHHSPLDQAHHFKKVLLHRFSELRMPCPNLGVAACFPDSPVNSEITQDDLAGRIIGSESLPFLDRVLPDLLERTIPERREPQKGWVSEIHRMWCESWIPERKLSRRKLDDAEIRLRLDREQMKILDMAEENDRVLVQGPPGTGKTVLAMELARREAAKGHRVLFLCYTESLGFELSRCLQHALVTASSIGAFALGLLREQGFDIIEEYTSEFWEPVTLQAACEALPDIKSRWDTIIVDEAQDMGENDWAFIEACAGNHARLWIFADPGQAFLPGRSIPIQLEKSVVKLNLKHPYRCPPAIQALADIFAGGQTDQSLIIEGIQNGIIKIIGVGPSEIDKMIGKEIDALLDEGFSRSEIAILSLRGLNCQDSIVNRLLIGGEPFCRASDPQSLEEIIGDTFLRFKGLERPAVIITDLRFVTDRLNLRLLIAVTRATSVLRIIDGREALSGISSLKPFVVRSFSD